MEEKRNQRHTRGHDANPLRSLETPTNVTIRAPGESRGFMWSCKKRKHNGDSHKLKD